MDSWHSPADPRDDAIHTRRRLLAGAGVGALGAAMLAPRPAEAQLPNPVDDRYVLRARMPYNVKDYGATGNGTTDDNPAIQSAIDAAKAAGGGVVFLPPGTYSITGISIPPRVELMGAGWQSVLKVAANAGIYPIYVQSGETGPQPRPPATDVRLHDFAIDGNKGAHPNHLTEGNPYHPDTGSEGPACAIQVGGAADSIQERIFVERVYLKDSLRMGIVFNSVVDGAIRDCLVADNNRDGITVYNRSKNLVISGNTVNRCADDHIAINSENTGHMNEAVTITGNVITGPSSRNKGPGIMVRGGKDIAIVGNVVRDVCQSAIEVLDFNATPATDIVISGNTIYRPGLNGSADKYGMNVAATNAGIKRLTIVGNNVQSTIDAAIRFFDSKGTPAEGDLADIVIASNSISDSGAGGIVTGSAGISDVLIEGNRVGGSTGNGIDFPAGKRINVRNNLVYRGSGIGIRISGVNSGSCEGNQVYDDRGTPNQTHGIYLHALSGVFGFRDNTVWGNTTDYDLHPGGHSARFEGPYRRLSGMTGWNPAPLPDGASTHAFVTVDGASPGDPCTVGIGANAPEGVILSATVVEANKVGVTMLNRSGDPVDVAGGLVFVNVEKPPPLT
jgi:hypothetical protein